jgi:membrane-associated phospholipid phosphatase
MPFARTGVALVVVLATATAAADPSERTDRQRVQHGAPVLLGGALYLVLELVAKNKIIPEHCRWCVPNSFDAGIRGGLRWDRVHAANTLSNLTGYLGNPLLAISVLGGSANGDWRRFYDDVTPVLQAGITAGVLNWIGKAIAVRRRPFAAFNATPVRAKHDYDTSFFSGHTALAFSMATSSGTVASLRGYRSATALWISGLSLATVTGYLRIAGDAHYATDVIAGAVIGGAIGVVVPLLFHRGS